MAEIALDKIYLKTLELLDEVEISYLIIGGVALGVLGEPRATIDIDFNIIIKSEQIHKFLEMAKSKGFEFNSDEILQHINSGSPFKLHYRDRWVDFIISSTAFEENVFNRRQKIRLFNKDAYFPTPEDLIILKIIAGRKKDIVDVESIMIRHKGRLDTKYMDKWFRQIADEAKDKEIWNRYQELLNEVYK